MDRSFNEVLFEDFNPCPPSVIDHPVMRLAARHGEQMTLKLS
jgi:hypothetical protein